MNFILQPWQLLLTILAGLINRQQQEVIEYLRTENQVLKKAQGKRRIRLNDDQRRRLAVKGKILGRKILREIGTAFSPDTLLRWHRQLVAEKWDYSDRRKTVGRPRVRPESEPPYRQVVHIAVDLGAVDLDVREEPPQKHRDAPAAESGNVYARRLWLPEQRQHHHLHIGRHQPCRIAKIYARLPLAALCREDLQTQLVALPFHDQRLAVAAGVVADLDRWGRGSLCAVLTLIDGARGRPWTLTGG